MNQKEKQKDNCDNAHSFPQHLHKRPKFNRGRGIIRDPSKRIWDINSPDFIKPLNTISQAVKSSGASEKETNFTFQSSNKLSPNVSPIRFSTSSNSYKSDTKFPEIDLNECSFPSSLSSLSPLVICDKNGTSTMLSPLKLDRSPTHDNEFNSHDNSCSFVFQNLDNESSTSPSTFSGSRKIHENGSLSQLSMICSVPPKKRRLTFSHYFHNLQDNNTTAMIEDLFRAFEEIKCSFCQYDKLPLPKKFFFQRLRMLCNLIHMSPDVANRFVENAFFCLCIRIRRLENSIIEFKRYCISYIEHYFEKSSKQANFPLEAKQRISQMSHLLLQELSLLVQRRLKLDLDLQTTCKVKSQNEESKKNDKKSPLYSILYIVDFINSLERLRKSIQASQRSLEIAN